GKGKEADEMFVALQRAPSHLPEVGQGACQAKTEHDSVRVSFGRVLQRSAEVLRFERQTLQPELPIARVQVAFRFLGQRQVVTEMAFGEFSALVRGKTLRGVLPDRVEHAEAHLV